MLYGFLFVANISNRGEIEEDVLDQVCFLLNSSHIRTIAIYFMLSLSHLFFQLERQVKSLEVRDFISYQKSALRHLVMFTKPSI